MKDHAFQKHAMTITNPGTTLRQQLETAEEMGLTKEDIERLQRKFPARYKDLAVAFGVTPA